jgi:hypothetical protein
VPKCSQFVNLSNTLINKIKPWGWSQITHKECEFIKPNSSIDFKNSPIFNWNKNHKQLFSRETSLEISKKIEEKHRYVGEENLPIVCDTLQQIEEIHRSRGQMVLKSPFSSSGRGVQILRKNKLNKYNIQWIESTLKTQKIILAEKLFDRVMDFAYQFKIEKGEISYLGNSFFNVNYNGSYEGNYIGNYNKNLPSDYYQFVKNNEEEIVNMLIQILSKSNYTKFYEGNIGIDSFLYIEDGKIQINPCVEINCRQNMGLLALMIDKKLNTESFGEFKIYFDKRNNYMDFCNEMHKQMPLKLKSGKISEGFLSLSNSSTDSTFGLYCEIKK